jgi:hypothetical protein
MIRCGVADGEVQSGEEVRGWELVLLRFAD